MTAAPWHPLPSEAVTPPCRTGDPDRWFDPARADTVKKECTGCPYRQPCLTYALEWAVEGVWGGTTLEERDALRKMSGRVATPLVNGRYVKYAGPAPHGTTARYRQHFREGTAPCAMCRDAEGRRRSPHNPAPWGAGT